MWAVVGPPLVPPLVPSSGSLFVPACLMFAAVCLDALPCHLIALVLGCVPSPSACLGSCLFPLAPSSMSVPVLLPFHCFSLPAPPHRHDGRVDTTVLRRFSRLRLLAPSARHITRAVRHRMATGLGSCSRPMSIIGAACYPLARTIRFPRRPSSHRLSPRSLDTGDGAVVYLRGFCVLRRRWLPCLLGCRIIYFVDGGCGSATVRVRPLICLDAPVHPLFVMSSRISIPHLDAYSGSGYLLHPFICPGTCRFSFDVLCPVRLLTMADGARHFLCVSSLRRAG